MIGLWVGEHSKGNKCVERSPFTCFVARQRRNERFDASGGVVATMEKWGRLVGQSSITPVHSMGTGCCAEATLSRERIDPPQVDSIVCPMPLNRADSYLVSPSTLSTAHITPSAAPRCSLLLVFARVWLRTRCALQAGGGADILLHSVSSLTT